MDDGGPYRSLPKSLSCPRCGEVLERAFEDVLTCMRCEGVWITPPIAGIAFDDPAWPPDASSMWWRSELECPECAYAGTPTTMAAQLCQDTQIDRCKDHGLWLDRGELGRLAGSTGDELGELRRRLQGDDADVEKLSAKRDAWRKDVEARRRQAEEHNSWLATEQARRIAAAEERDREDQRRYEVEQRSHPAEPVPRPPTVAQAVRDRARLTERDRRDRSAEQIELEEASRAHAEVRRTLLDDRHAMADSVDDLENRLARLREELHVTEAELAGARIKLRGLTEQIAKFDAEPKLR